MTELREAGGPRAVSEAGRTPNDTPEATPPSGDAREGALRRTGSARPFPTFLQALGLVVLVLVLQSAFGVAALLLDPTSGAYSQHPLTLGVVNLLAFGIVILVAARRRGIGARAVCPFAPVSAGTFFLVAVLLLGTVILLSDIDNLTRSVLPPPEALVEAFENILNAADYPLSSFFLLVVVAPVTEEALFRGLILRGFLANYSKRRAILLSALLFAVMHTNPWQFISAFVAGVLLAWLLIETGSLIPCLFAHALANGMAYLAALLPVEVPGFTGGMGDAVQFQPFWLNALGAFFVVAGYLSLRRGFREAAHTPRDPYRRPGLTS